MIYNKLCLHPKQCQHLHTHTRHMQQSHTSARRVVLGRTTGMRTAGAAQQAGHRRPGSNSGLV